MQPGEVLVYALRDPLSGDLFYVGSTMHPDKRLNVHLSMVRRGKDNTLKGRRIGTLLIQGYRPEMVELEWCTTETRNIKEADWIDKVKPSTNMSEVFRVLGPKPSQNLPLYVYVEDTSFLEGVPTDLRSVGRSISFLEGTLKPIS